MPDDLRPPRATRRPTTLRAHGDERVDDWYWLRDRDDPEVLAYLESENAYTAAALARTADLRERCYREIVARVEETDVSAPVPWAGWVYVTRTYEGKQYPVHLRRRPDTRTADGDEVVLDENVLADGHDYFSLGSLAPSPDHSLVAYAIDVEGGERHELRIRSLTTGEDLPDRAYPVSYGLAWADDNRTLWYVAPDDAMRPWQVWRHVVGSASSDDVLAYQEDDERFHLSLGRMRSGGFLAISSDSKVTSEVRLLPAARPGAEWLVVEPRAEGVEYAVEHHRGHDGAEHLFIVTNRGGRENFALMRAPASTPGAAHWEDFGPYNPAVRTDDVDAFLGHVVRSERAEGLTRLVVLDPADPSRAEVVPMPDPVHTVGLGPNPEYDGAPLRYEYTSLVLPPASFDHDPATGTTTLVKVEPVRGGYDATRFRSARLWATAPDGTRVPISVVHRADLALDGHAPCLLYGYGSYEISIDPGFSISRLSLLERGFVFAIAHVRGGGELGRRWYEDGKLLAKPHTFTDFVACAEHLVAEGYTAPDRLAARGASAGGLLMGAVANLRPDLFRAIVAEVPFVDCLTTILDETLPLTVTEWEEWGNPVDDPAVYALMRSYSPYDNVGAFAYPAMLVTAGLNDPRVSYWEPAKWVAKLRSLRTDDRLLVLRTELGTGHHGPSGRYDAWRDEALVLAFVIDQLDAPAEPLPMGSIAAS